MSVKSAYICPSEDDSPLAVSTNALALTFSVILAQAVLNLFLISSGKSFNFSTIVMDEIIGRLSINVFNSLSFAAKAFLAFSISFSADSLLRSILPGLLLLGL